MMDGALEECLDLRLLPDIAHQCVDPLRVGLFA
jgi:hypothetical protein